MDVGCRCRLAEGDSTTEKSHRLQKYTVRVETHVVLVSTSDDDVLTHA